MKLTKVLAAVCCLAIGALSFTSCETTVVTHAYGLGIHKFGSNGSGNMMYDLAAVTEYLNEKGCPTDGQEAIVTIVDTSDKNCDKKAAEIFKGIVKDLSYEEVAALGLSADCTFSYSMQRSQGPGTDPITVAEWNYPQE